MIKEKKIDFRSRQGVCGTKMLFYITLCVVGTVCLIIGIIAGGIWIYRKCYNDDSQSNALAVPRIVIVDEGQNTNSSPGVNTRRRALSYQDLGNVTVTLTHDWRSSSDMNYNTPQGMLQPGLYPTPTNPEPFSMGRIFFLLQYNNQEEELALFIKEVISIPGRIDEKNGERKMRNPFVRVYLLPRGGVIANTKVHIETLNPEFKEIFKKKVPYEELQGAFLRFLLCDKVDDETYSSFAHVAVPLIRENMTRKVIWRDCERD
ncbi:hypothetical protein NPIL_545411 [Nephila pilipes]|uniref:C2 domain-containing protein n=1 Tax=Nephila pilipes TaxID=299642 RepID=A0A8X6IAL0_NEPPI|nr:hypothetical protein NPIL_545411 [Nephila pilipes]